MDTTKIRSDLEIHLRMLKKRREQALARAASAESDGEAMYQRGQADGYLTAISLIGEAIGETRVTA
jgi:hypothetical protein